MKAAHKESGYIIVTVAVLSIALVGLAALAIDSGVLMDTRTGAQRIVDASALAGAFTFIATPTAPQPDRARQHALETALQQDIRGTAPLAENINIEVDVAERTVTVTMLVTEQTFFAPVLGFGSADIQVTATAEASTNATGSTCTKPWMLPNSVLLPEGTFACEACPGSPDYNSALEQQLLILNGAPTQHALNQIEAGTQFSIKPQRPADALQPGQFYVVQVSDASGADPYRQNITTCSGDVFCSNCYGVEPGNMVGPTRLGVDDLIGDPPDVYGGVGCYGDGCSDTSPSLIVVPVWDPCNRGGIGCESSGFCPDSKFDDTGANINVGVIGFATIFVDGMVGNDVGARLIGVTPCAVGGGAGDDGSGGGDADAGPFAVQIRLVRPAE